MVEIAGEHGEDTLRSFCNFCGRFLNAFAAASALKATSSPDERSQCVASFNWLQTNWPLAVPEGAADSGLDYNDVKDAVGKEKDRIEKSTGESMEMSLKNVTKQVKACLKLLEGLNVEQETEFRAAMAGSAGKIASASQKLKGVSDQVITAYQHQSSSFSEKHGELCTEVAETEAMCIYFLAVYAAMTLYRDSQTWMKVPGADKARANLKRAVSSLNAAPVVAVEIKFNHQVVTEMRDELKVPRPATKARVSDQAVSTVSGQLVATDQAVSTMSAATVSDEPVSAGSVPEDSARSVLVGDPTSGGTHGIEDAAQPTTKRPRGKGPCGKGNAKAKAKGYKVRKVATGAEAAASLRRSARFIPALEDTRNEEDLADTMKYADVPCGEEGEVEDGKEEEVEAFGHVD